MKIFVARFISIVGHPFVLLSLFILSASANRSRQDTTRSFTAFALIVLLPLVLLIWHERSSGRWQTVDASNKEDRPVLYLVAIAALAIAATYYYLVEQVSALVGGCLVTNAILVVAFILNRWIKVSLHAAVALFCGLDLLRVHLYTGWIVLGWVPLLIWSRLTLSRHTISEIVCGLLLGGLGATFLRLVLPTNV